MFRCSPFFRRALFALLLVSIFSARGHAAPTPPASGRVTPDGVLAPSVIALDELNLPSTAPRPEVVVTVHPSARRVYIGRMTAIDRLRRNLVVVTLDENGKPAGERRLYPLSDFPVPGGALDTLQSILVDAPRRKLYIISSFEGTSKGGAGENLNRNLSVYDLDADGEPIGKPRAYKSGNAINQPIAGVLHPKLNLLYLAGNSGSSLTALQLDAKGEPTGEPMRFATALDPTFSLAVAPDGRRLYAGNVDAITVVDLDENGKPAGAPRRFSTATEREYIRLQLGARSLYFLRKGEAAKKIVVWPLGENGDPSGAPLVQQNISGQAFAVETARPRLWIAENSTFPDAFSGQIVNAGVAPVLYGLDDKGLPAAAGNRSTPGARQTGAAVGITAKGTAVFVTATLPADVWGNRVKDFRLRATILEARPRDAAAADAKWETVLVQGAGASPTAQTPLGNLAAGETSTWVNLDSILRDQRGQVAVRVSAGGAFTGWTPGPLSHLKLRVEIAEGDPAAGGRVLKTLTDEVMGSEIVLLLPGYAMDDAERTQWIETYTEHSRRYLNAAQKAASELKLMAGDRPRLFPIDTSNLVGGQGSVEELNNLTKTAGLLGFNAVGSYWWDMIPPAEVDRVLDANGLERRTLGAFMPPGYFEYEQDKMNPAALQQWAKDYAVLAPKQNGGKASDVFAMAISDEPLFIYPSLIYGFRDNVLSHLDHRDASLGPEGSPTKLDTPELLKIKQTRREYFHRFLGEKGFKPGDFGKANWNEIVPLLRSEATDLPSRKLFYWSMRFFPESATAGHKLVTEALRKEFGHKIQTWVNWNNWLGQWYSASPNERVSYIVTKTPDSAAGSFDWLHSGRKNAHTPWTEDWFPDRKAQLWSLYGDALRSSAMLGDETFGAYIIGDTMGQFDDGPSYKFLSLLGHGGKAVSVWTFGPNFISSGNGWSEQLQRYKPMALAMKRVARAERVLFPGKPERGKVALGLPGSSWLWDEAPGTTHYSQEIYSLHFALIHAGYTVDFVDEADVTSGALAEREYSALYITGPNMANAAQAKLRDWVQSGGTLVATPGAATFDEYNQPTTVLDEVLGLTARRADRTLISSTEPSADSEPITDALSITDARFGGGEVSLRGAVTPLQTKGASTLAKLQAGETAIAAQTFGKGRAISYGFFPGWQYWLTPDRNSDQRPPLGWGAAQRQLAVAPAVIANTPKVVSVDIPAVEAARMQSDKGIAVTLLNWTGAPLSQITVTIPRTGKFKKVTSSEGVAVKSTPVGDGLRVTLPLKSVDVLMIE